MSAPVLEKLLLAMKNSKGVPATERSVASVLGALDNSHSGKQQVVGHIIEDFALTQKVLKLANSTMYAPFGNGSASVSSAVDVLGSEAVLHLVLGADLVSDEELQKDEHLSQSLLASELARTALAHRAEDASIATLMVEIGRLMVGKYLPAESAAIAIKVAAGSAPELAAKAVMGMSYQEIGVELAARWNLPQTLRDTIDGTGDPTLVGIARFASAASTLIHQGQSESVASLIQNLDLPGVDKGKLGALVSHRSAQLQSARPVQEEPSRESALAELLRELTETEWDSLDALSSAMLAGLGELLKTAHCLLFMSTRTGEMRVRSAFGKGVDELKSRLRISAEFMPTAFHAAIKNKIDVSIADVSKLKDTSLPEHYRTLLPHVTKFIILPIANERVSGLLYCDWDADTLLRPSEMDGVKKLRNLLLPYFPA
jgi:HD-like signal output (HDOD) protein